MKEIYDRKNQSPWIDGIHLPHFPSLKDDRTTDVLIIGGGMAGILCAYMLEQAGMDYMLVEAETVCSGMTENTTAKLTVQHGLIFHRLIQKFGAEKARMYLDANQEALREYEQLCRNIDCDFEKKDSFVYSMDRPEILNQEIEAMRRLNLPAQRVYDLPLSFQTAGAVKLPEQAQFHPLKFIRAIMKERQLKIYEHTMVKNIKGNQAYTGSNIITAQKIIAATHFPFINRHGSYFLKMYQHRSYVAALEGDNIPDLNGIYLDDNEKGMSFRNYRNLLFVGGGAHRTGKQGGGWEEIKHFAAQHYPDAEVKYCWAAQDCMTLDGIPYIGRYSLLTPDLYVATGFNKWGMTSSMAAARILTDLILDGKSPYEEVFSPSRTMFRKQLFLNMTESVKNLLTPTVPRCTHLGCALKWNAAEHSWDCPCHGSRFEEDGELLNNPAKKSKRNIRG
ncbi:MAG: FAD-dependent oxidoreductase [Brotaphodocola sp.]